MNPARKALNDPDRMLELEDSLDGEVADLNAEAEDAGYSGKESVKAMEQVLRNQVIRFAPLDRHFLCAFVLT